MKNDLQLYIWNQQSLLFFIHVNGVRYSVSTSISDWKENEWHLIEARISANAMELILDGVSRGAKQLNGVAKNALNGLQSNISIGGNGSANWNGVIDQLIIK